jgi:Icc protein
MSFPNWSVQESYRTAISRRGFIKTAAVAAGSLALPALGKTRGAILDKPIKIGLITDLHQDIMHDGPERMAAFAKAMETFRPDATLQLGDFAVPSSKNQKVADLFNTTSAMPLHVLGNHDMDGGHKKEQCLIAWKMPQRYYSREIQGLTLLVLDGNDAGSPTHKGGYAAYVGKEQTQWLADQLNAAKGPVIVISHQPLAGPSAIDNAQDVQTILTAHADKILAALCGHTHIDYLLRVGNVPYLHLNSASYFWVGPQHAHPSYPAEIHEKYRTIANTCPYRDVVFSTLTVTPDGSVSIEGRQSDWVGRSPGALGFGKGVTLTDGEEIAPRIRNRRLAKVQPKAGA